VDGTGLDGEPRVHAVARLAGPGDGAPLLFVGLSRARAVEAADRALRRDLLRVGALTLLALVAAALLGELLVLRRVRALVEATERIAGGRLDLSTGVPHDAGEVGRIAEAVDRMTEALRARAAEAERAVAALRRGEERYRSLVVGTSQIVWTTDATGAVVEELPSWRAVTGQTPEETRGFGWFDAVHPDDRERARTALERAARRGRLSTHCRLRTASGEYRHYAVHGVPVVEPDGRTVREWVGFCTDVTDQRAAEEALRRSEEAQRQGQKLEAVGRLAGGIAHDFNNLLTAIRSYTELLLDDERLGAEPRGDVEEIQKAADRAAALVRQLLAFSRRQPVRPALLEVDAVVRDTEALLRRLIGAEFVLAVVPGAPGARVRVDRAQIEQVLFNLVLNARDAMPDGGTITVSTAVRAGEGAGGAGPADAVELTVRDTGVGMDEATRARIFEPFFTTKAPGVGTGLGLATVYGAVQQAGGRVAVESAPGAGTTFRVLLPRADERAAVPAPPATPGETAGERPPPGPPPAPAPDWVLLADDEAALRSAAARVLRRAGHTVLEADDGEAALALWQRHRGEIGLLLTDVRMPRLNGVALAERIRADAPELPVVLMTAFADELVARAERSLPDAPRVAKPFEVRALVEAVEAALARAAPHA
jgi:PAS domain S-box-containing protein